MKVQTSRSLRWGLIGATLLTILLLSGFTSPRSTGAIPHTGAALQTGLDPAKLTTTGKYCVIGLAHVQPGQRESAITQWSCHATFAAAISAATSGRVKLAASVRPQDLTPAMLGQTPSSGASIRPSTTTNVIAEEFVDDNYQGASLTVTTTGGQCFSTQPNWDYALFSMPSGWNDVITSARNFFGCSRGEHYENINFGGAHVACRSCANIGGAMNDRTSSIQYSAN